MRDIDIAWVAGLLEGEGCFSRHVRKTNGKICYAVHCEMSDEDTIKRLHNITQLGTVTLRLNKSGRVDRTVRKPTWIWSIQNKPGIVQLLTKILPYMGERRSEKIKLILGDLIENR